MAFCAAILAIDKPSNVLSTAVCACLMEINVPILQECPQRFVIRLNLLKPFLVSLSPLEFEIAALRTEDRRITGRLKNCSALFTRFLKHCFVL